jgi:hypothetical protein
MTVPVLLQSQVPTQLPFHNNFPVNDQIDPLPFDYAPFIVHSNITLSLKLAALVSNSAHKASS